MLGEGGILIVKRRVNAEELNLKKVYVPKEWYRLSSLVRNYLWGKIRVENLENTEEEWEVHPIERPVFYQK